MGTGAYHIPTYAAAAGTVTLAGEMGTAGLMVEIDHGDGLVTKYMHHDKIYVEEGQKVEKGQQIGLSGTTGNSTGNHLHFQVEEDGVAIHPSLYLGFLAMSEVLPGSAITGRTSPPMSGNRTSIPNPFISSQC